MDGVENVVWLTMYHVLRVVLQIIQICLDIYRTFFQSSAKEKRQKRRGPDSDGGDGCGQTTEMMVTPPN